MITKAHIPKALREQVWRRHVGKVYSHKCSIKWCSNEMTVFDFQCGHDIPESKGGETILENLQPICSRCNLSMSNNYSIQEWNTLSQHLTCWQNIMIRLFPSLRKRFGIKVSGIKSRQSHTNQNDKRPKLRGE